MKRITGNWIRKRDKKEQVIAAWSFVEEFLQRKSLIFSLQKSHPEFDLNNIVDSVGRYENLPLFSHYELDEAFDRKEAEELREKAKKDLLDSRARFLQNINKFGIQERGTYVLGYESLYTTKIWIDFLSLHYSNGNDSCISFDIFPSGWFSYNGEYVSNRKDGRRYRDKVLNRGPDAQNLIVKASSSPEIENEVKKIYQSRRKTGK